MLALILVANKKSEIVLHVGMHKTGTTFLQWNVFHYVNANYLWHIFYKSWLRDLLNLKKKVDYQKIKNKLSKVLSTKKINIFSEENIYTYQFTKIDDRFKRLDRIKQAFPEVKIIFGTRKKEENIVSWYVEYVAVGGVLNFQEFLEKHLNQDKFDYEPYIKKLKEYYGSENVFVYSLDELRKNQDKVVRDMCKFMNVEAPIKYRKQPARIGYSLRILKISLFLNKLFKTPVNTKGIIPWWGPILPQNIFFHSFIFRKIPKKKIKIDDLKNLK